MKARHILAAVPMPLVLVGPDERVTAANEAAEAMFGAGMTGRHYITALRQPVLLDCVERALKSGKETTARLPLREGGRDSTYKVRAAPISDRRGAMLSLEDVSHVRQASQMRRDFVANVSHELRSPLTALLGFIETLRGPARDDPAARERFLAVMGREAERMSRLIQDLLSLSRVEAEERRKPETEVDIAALAGAAAATLQPLADETGVTLHLAGADAPMTLRGDADQLLQVLTNLIENAIKYGGDAVWVALTRQEHDPALRGPALRIEVRDNGEGIDTLHLPRLTERFYRVDNHRSREMGGTGLGLAIVKHIVNRHRGRLRIDSQPGQGSRFVVVLPA